MIINLSKLNTELTTLRLHKEESAKVKLTFDEDKAKLEKKIEELEAKLKSMEEKHTESKKEEAAVIIAVEESVNKKVVQNLASLGVPEGTVKDEVAITAVSTDPTELYKKYESMAGKEKIEFFKKNEKAVLKGMKSFHFDNNPLAKTGINTKF
jgi:predicted metal-dependent peptidase